MARTFPFIDDQHDVETSPPEVRPGRENQRFPLALPKPNVAPDSYTRAGQKLAERLAEAANIRRAAFDEVSPGDVPSRVVRAFEAIDADPGRNVSSMASGTLRDLPVDGGVLYVLDVAVNPMAVVPDPNNGRNALNQLARRRAPLDVDGEDEALRLPRMTVHDAGQFVDMCRESQSALGFFQPQVAAGKDLNDLVSIGLQGVHNPIVLVPTVLRDEKAQSTVVVIVKEGNRRVAAALRALAEATGSSQSSLAAWSFHLNAGDGTELRDVDAEGVNEIRRAAMHGDLKGGVWWPTGGAKADLDAFEDKLERSIRQRTAVRVRTIQAQLVVGYDPGSLAPDIRSSPSPLEALVQRYVRSIHIAEAAQKQWSSEAQNINVFEDALRRAAAHHRAGGDFQPMTAEEVDAVLDCHTVDWGGASDASMHPLRLAVKIFAEVACDNHDATSKVREAMKAFNMPVQASKVAEGRARIAAERITPLSGLSNPESGLYKRVRTGLDRICRSKVFTACSTHPNADSLVWWECLDMSIADLVTQASAERAASLDLSDEDRRALTERTKGAGIYGAATRALILLASFAQTMSPAVTADTRGGHTSAFQLTVSGLGNTRGNTATSPDLVMSRVADTAGGIEQLAVIVRSAISSPPELPANTIAPDFETGGDPSTKGLVTEAFLRSEHFGWTEEDAAPADDVPPPEVPPTPAQQYAAMVEKVLHGITRAHEDAQAILTDDDLDKEFRSHGIAKDPEYDIQRLLTELLTIISDGHAYAGRNES